MTRLIRSVQRNNIANAKLVHLTEDLSIMKTKVCSMEAALAELKNLKQGDRNATAVPQVQSH